MGCAQDLDVAGVECQYIVGRLRSCLPVGMDWERQSELLKS